jgi:hypothetical protein
MIITFKVLAEMMTCLPGGISPVVSATVGSYVFNVGAGVSANVGAGVSSTLALSVGSGFDGVGSGFELLG